MSLTATLRERVPDRNLWIVYATTWVLATAYGLALALTPIVLHGLALGDVEVSNLAASFGLGIVTFAIPAGAIIRRVSAKRTLVVCIIGYASMIGVFPFLTELWHLALCRFLDGAFSVGVWVSCETLLLLRARAAFRAFATSLYAIATGLGYFVGGGLSWALLHVMSSTAVFVLAATIAVLSSFIALESLERDPPPAPPTEPAAHEPAESGGLASWASLAYRIKTSSVATFCTGFFQAACVIYLPFYLMSEKGIDANDTTLVTALSAGGMLVISNVAGRIGDTRGHLATLRALTIIGIATLVSFHFLEGLGAILVAVLIGGGSLASIPPLSLALQGSIARPDEYARSNSIFNVFFASGLLLGPLITGRVSEAFDRTAILWLFAALWGAMAIVSIVFRRDDPAASRALA